MAKIHCGTILLLLVVVVVSQHVVKISDLVKLRSQRGQTKLRTDRTPIVEAGLISYQVFIKQLAKRKGYHENICSGGLIGIDKILSSAGCFTEDGNSCQKMCKKTPMRNLKNLFAVAGSIEDKARYKEDGASSEQWRKLKSAHIAPGFKFPKNDIAVVFTSKPFVINKNVQFLLYATKDMDYKTTSECVETSFSSLNKVYRFYFRHVALKSKSQCKSLHGENMDDFLCTNHTLSGSILANRGSPLACSETGDPKEVGLFYVGVLSGYRKKGKEWRPYYTRVGKHSAFILKKASRNLPLLNIVWIPLIMSNFG